MCGRFALTISPEILARHFQLAEPPPISANYNISPSQKIAAVLNSMESTNRRLKMLQWGLIPSWAKDPALGTKMINARSESVWQKPAFREAV